MLNQLKKIFYVVATISFLIFIFFYYFSEENKKNTNKIRSQYFSIISNNVSSIPLLPSDTDDIINFDVEFQENKTKKKKRKFWELISK